MNLIFPAFGVGIAFISSISFRQATEGEEEKKE